jgi:hypothetical protein
MDALTQIVVAWFKVEWLRAFLSATLDRLLACRYTESFKLSLNNQFNRAPAINSRLVEKSRLDVM